MNDIENSYWAGQRIGDMTREELIAALGLCAHMARERMEAHRQTLEAWSHCNTLRSLPHT